VNRAGDVKSTAADDDGINVRCECGIGAQGERQIRQRAQRNDRDGGIGRQDVLPNEIRRRRISRWNAPSRQQKPRAVIEQEAPNTRKSAVALQRFLRSPGDCDITPCHVRQQAAKILHPWPNVRHAVDDRNRLHLDSGMLEQIENRDIIVKREIGIDNDGPSCPNSRL